MDIPFVVFGSVVATAGYNPHSMNARFINNYMVVMSFKLGKTIPKHRAIVVPMVRIRADLAIKYKVIRTWQAPMA